MSGLGSVFMYEGTNCLTSTNFEETIWSFKMAFLEGTNGFLFLFDEQLEFKDFKDV